MKAFSTGLPGRMKSSCTPRRYAQSSSARDVNSVPRSTVIERGVDAARRTRSSASATARPDMAVATSSKGLWRLHLIDDGQHAKRPRVGEGIVHEVHAPPLGRARRDRRRSAMQGDVFPSPDAHPKLQAFQAIEATHPLPV